MAKIITPPSSMEQLYTLKDLFDRCEGILGKSFAESTEGRHINIIKRQDEKQDAKFSRVLKSCLGDDRVDSWDFLSGRVPRKRYQTASALFTTHDCDNLGRLFENVSSILVPKGVFFVVDYNLKWIKKHRGQAKKRELFDKWFSFDNEIKEKQALENAVGNTGWQMCYETHTRYGLRDHIAAGRQAGFETLLTNSYPAETPKFFLYAGRKM